MALKKYMTPEELENALIANEIQTAEHDKLLKELKPDEPTSAWDDFLYGKKPKPDPIIEPDVPSVSGAEDVDVD